MLNRLRKDEDRYASRMARIARWDRPITGGFARGRAWANMLLSDHGVFRLLYLNAHQVTDGLWRSAQPTPRDIARFARNGIRTVVNLRGGREHGGWPLEREACQRHGLALTEFVLRSRGAPDAATILAFKPFVEKLDGPLLVHCKSGADRAGLFAALYLLVIENRPLAEAKAELSFRYGHFRFAKTGILDAFFDTYAREGEPSGQPFLDWVRDSYDPVALEANFKPSFWSSLVADAIIRRE